MKKFNVSEYVIWNKQVVQVSRTLQRGNVQIAVYVTTGPDMDGGIIDFYRNEIVKGYELKTYNKQNFKKTFYKEMIKEMSQWQADFEIDMMFN